MLQKLSLKLSKVTSNRIKIYSIIALTSLSISAILVFFPAFFQVKNISIEGDSTGNHIIGIENIRNSNLLFFPSDKIIEIILANNPQIESVIINKVFPNTVILKITNSKPLAYFKLNQGYATVDEKGKVLSKNANKSEDLPVINYYQQFDYSQLNIGSTLNYIDLTTSLFLLKKTSELDTIIDSIDINGLSMIVFNLKGKQIFFTSDKPKETQSYQLETLIRQFKIEAKDFKVLDLRFEKPVVTF